MTTSNINIIHLESIDSTNAHARRLAEKGEGGPLWISAQTQTAGRGRRGREWVSETGNLFATHLITLPVPPAIATQISFVTALAIHETCAALLPQDAPLTLKWPNDVLLKGKKLAGILLETLPSQNKNQTVLAIGCGVNIAHAPAETPYGATWLNAHIEDLITPGQFINILAPRMSHWLDTWKNSNGFDLICKAWQNRASHVGKTVSLALASQTITGKFTGLASDGALILELPDGIRKHYHAGDVSFRTRSSNAE